MQSGSFGIQDTDAEGTCTKRACIRVTCTGSNYVQNASTEGADTQNTFVRGECTNGVYFGSACIRTGTCSGDVCIWAANIWSVGNVFLRNTSVGDSYTKGVCL